VEDLVLERNVDDRVFGEDLLHLVLEDLPLVRAPEVVHHQEAAPQEVVPQRGGFLRRHRHAADFQGV